MQGVESTTVLHSIDDEGVLTLTLNRPERNNAWTYELERALNDLLEQAALDTAVRAVIVTGAGRSFCPGLDSEVLSKVSRTTAAADRTGRRPIQTPAFVPKPVICAINGGCAGLGLVTALMCDVRFVAEHAKISTAFVRRGLPAEEAVGWMLPRIVGHATALELLLSGRTVASAEALALGLVHRVYPGDELMGAAIDYARELARSCSPLAMATVKRQVYLDWERSLGESRLDSQRLVTVLKQQSGDFREGVQSFLDKRPPAFEGLGLAIDTTALGSSA